jgi:hypothetical protein
VNNYSIDFVIPWVDGEDPSWRAEKNKYMRELSPSAFHREESASASMDDANSDCRFRELGFLRYWFRGVEQFAPWVNKVYFITCGQKPDWLNLDHPKLVCVNHRDYIPEKYLPTFNANTIELNFHRIEGLSEHYVYFNDDMYLLRSVEPSFFFKDGKPVLTTDLRYPRNIGYNNWSRILFNDYCLINQSFNIGQSIWDNRRKWFNIQELGIKTARRNFLCFFVNQTLPMGVFGHVALPHRKSTLTELWDRYPDILESSCRHKFRSDDQVNQWLLCGWNQAKGCFYPTRDCKIGKNYNISPRNIEKVVKVITNQAEPQICINDTNSNIELERICSDLLGAFSVVFPNKSSFEKDF